MPACPNDLDERMELYCLNRLRPDEATRFEDHLAICPACLYEALDTDMFLESLISALEEVTAENEGQTASRPPRKEGFVLSTRSIFITAIFAQPLEKV